ncbi:MAG: hypothetical protein JO057_12130 [Chloroflexi bacterium]|nr:hypothetical protein [Chloroflexota bacterium]
MPEPRVFCQSVMHEYERQWSRAAGHSVRHPLRLKMTRLALLCDDAPSEADFDARLGELQASTDVGDELLADELLPLWQAACAGRKLPFEDF